MYVCMCECMNVCMCIGMAGCAESLHIHACMCDTSVCLRVSKAQGQTLTLIECVLLLENVFSYYRMCSLTRDCVLLL